MKPCTLFFLVLFQLRITAATSSFSDVVQFDPSFETALAAQLIEDTDLALQYLSRYKPTRLLSALAKPQKSKIAKLVAIQWTRHSKSLEQVSPLHQAAGGFTKPVRLSDPKEADIIVHLFFDQLVLDPQGNRHPDAFIRILATLASQFHGPVEALLKLPIHRLKQISPESQRRYEIKGHQAAQSLLAAVLADDKPGRPSSIALHLREAIVREQQMIGQWNELPKGECGGLFPIRLH